MRVLVADDHPLYREALAETVKQRPELELVGTVAGGREALAAIQETPPEVAVLDMKMPGLDGMRLPVRQHSALLLRTGGSAREA